MVWFAERKDQYWQSWKLVMCSAERKRQSWQRVGVGHCLSVGCQCSDTMKIQVTNWFGCLTKTSAVCYYYRVNFTLVWEELYKAFYKQSCVRCNTKREKVVCRKR